MFVIVGMLFCKFESDYLENIAYIPAVNLYTAHYFFVVCILESVWNFLFLLF